MRGVNIPTLESFSGTAIIRGTPISRRRDIIILQQENILGSVHPSPGTLRFRTHYVAKPPAAVLRRSAGGALPGKALSDRTIKGGPLLALRMIVDRALDGVIGRIFGKYRLACANVLPVDIVTAEGRFRVAEPGRAR